MNELFAQIKEDLTDRRLLPAVAAVCVLFVAALAYALLGGGGSSSSTNGLPPVPVVPSSKGISVSGATEQKAVAETTDGFKDQSHGVARDPFAPLPGSATSAVVPAPAPGPAPGPEATSSSASSSSSSVSETPSSSGPEASTPSEPQKGKSKKKAKTAYDVAIKFGVLPPNTAPELAQLTEYKKLKLQTPLPSAEQPLIVFRGVTAKGRSATFTLVGEAILTGTGACLPSPAQCQAVDLKPGETEQLNYLQPNGESVIYELRVLSIEKRAASAASAKASVARRHPGSEEWGVSRVGQELLRKAGLVALPFLRYSSQPGVLVFAKPKAKKAAADHARGALRG
jgi:hypothetical protein